MEAIVVRSLAPVAAIPRVTFAGLRRALGDCVLAGSFLLAMLPAARALSFTLAGAANVVWMTGAAIMAIMSFARFAARTSAVNWRTLAATGGMLILPVYMGRSFGILPANRGIVSKGPFRSVRHPIYFGWLMLSLGYAMSFASERNILLIAMTLPFMVWRIGQEEVHLSADPEYLQYMKQVRYRLWPGVL